MSPNGKYAITPGYQLDALCATFFVEKMRFVGGAPTWMTRSNVNAQGRSCDNDAVRLGGERSLRTAASFRRQRRLRDECLHARSL